MFVYLDNSSTTKPYEEVKNSIIKLMEEDFGNPSSMHRLGLNVEIKIKQSRKIIAKSLGCTESEIIFTSGGTESNNHAIFGAVRANLNKGKHIITTKIEHPSVLNVYKELENRGYRVTYLNVNKFGFINLEELKESISDETILISIMYVNNEIGSIQPIYEIGKYINSLKNRPHFHVDGVQAYGKIKFKPKDFFADTLSISGHKIHGPKGIGALYINSNSKISNLLFGGGQEFNIRPGTENTLGIIGFGKAVEIMLKNNNGDIEKIKKLRKLLYDGINKIDCAFFNTGLDDKFAPHILNVSFEGLRGEVILHSLEMKKIYVSTGSACSSNKKKSFSHVLNAIKINDKLKEGAIRFSLSHLNTASEIEYVIENLIIVIDDLEKIIKRR